MSSGDEIKFFTVKSQGLGGKPDTESKKVKKAVGQFDPDSIEAAGGFGTNNMESADPLHALVQDDGWRKFLKKYQPVGTGKCLLFKEPDKKSGPAHSHKKRGEGWEESLRHLGDVLINTGLTCLGFTRTENPFTADRVKIFDIKQEGGDDPKLEGVTKMACTRYFDSDADVLTKDYINSAGENPKVTENYQKGHIHACALFKRRTKKLKRITPDVAEEIYNHISSRIRNMLNAAGLKAVDVDNVRLIKSNDGKSYTTSIDLSVPDHLSDSIGDVRKNIRDRKNVPYLTKYLEAYMITKNIKFNQIKIDNREDIDKEQWHIDIKIIP